VLVDVLDVLEEVLLVELPVLLVFVVVLLTDVLLTVVFVLVLLTDVLLTGVAVVLLLLLVVELVVFVDVVSYRVHPAPRSQRSHVLPNASVHFLHTLFTVELLPALPWQSTAAYSSAAHTVQSTQTLLPALVSFTNWPAGQLE
jgi:hypothetical protein